MPLSIGIDSELGSSGAAYTSSTTDSPVSLLRDYAESALCSLSASRTSQPRASHTYQRLYAVSPALSLSPITESPPALSPRRYQRTERTNGSVLSARPPLLLAVIHVLLMLIAYNNAISYTPFVDMANTAAIDEHGQLTLASHLYSPLCTALTRPPLLTLHKAVMHLLCLCAAFSLHMVGCLLVLGCVVAVGVCVRCGRCGDGAMQYMRRLGWCALFGWTALYGWRCHKVTKLDDKIV